MNTENENPIVVGCNYHTTWQRDKGMRFVLGEVIGEKAKLYTRNTKKQFWTNVSDLIFITTPTNIRKKNKLTAQNTRL